MNFKKLLLGALLTISSLSPSFSSEWNDVNRPSNFEKYFLTVFNFLPKSGSLSTKPWTDTYWPTFKGGISYRWLTGESTYRTPGYSSKGVDYLSPAEKYDLFVGDNSFSLTNYERKRTQVLTNNNIPEWEGLCHGWAPAAYLYKSPNPIKVKAKNGEMIQFGSSDIKALLTYNMHLNGKKSKYLGSRCNLSDKETDISRYEECNDTNAGAFHIVLTNLIGRKNTSFVIDRTRDSEVWNQPVTGFEVKVLGQTEPNAEAARGTVKQIIVETKVYWVTEISPQWDNVGTEISYSVYKYSLDIARGGKIIGGSWITWERPDFIWTQSKPGFEGILSKLGHLYRLSN